jgi:hypothetical protein
MLFAAQVCHDFEIYTAWVMACLPFKCQNG